MCGCGGMADASDSKSDEGDLVWVQVPLSAVNHCFSNTFVDKEVFGVTIKF